MIVAGIDEAGDAVLEQLGGRQRRGEPHVLGVERRLVGYMRSNRNDCALASSASPRESWNDACRWQSTKPGVATVSAPVDLCAPV